MALSIQKASFWKRISAYLFDFIVAAMLTVGIATIFSAVLNIDAQTAKLQAYQTEYETEYDVDFSITEEAYNELPEEEREVYELVDAAMRKDERITNTNRTLFLLILVTVSVSLLLGVLIVQFFPPLFFKNGQTLGKKIFGIAVVRSNCVKVSNPVLFIRSAVGMYAIETMFPVALILMVYFNLLGSLGAMTVLLLLVLQIGCLLASKNNCAIHDLLTDTVVVDMATQRIFDSEEAMLAFKQEEHAQEVAEAKYP